MPRRIADYALVLTFLLGLGVYAGTSLRTALTDRQGLMDALDLKRPWKSLPSRIEEFFRNHALGHEWIVQSYASLKSQWLGCSSNPKVWLGRDGWLFFNHSADQRYLAAHDTALTERLNRWAEALQHRRAWLASRNIKFLVVVPPDKQSIYPEYLPRLALRHGPQPLDVLLDRCRRDAQFNLLDLRPALRAASAHGPLYRLTDSHWTASGIYAGYAATTSAMGHWFDSVVPDSRSEFEFVSEPSAGGDLARLLGLGGALFETVQKIERKTPARARPSNETVDFRPEPLLSHVQSRVWTHDQPSLPRVVLLGDSFADDTFCELLAEHCSRLVRVGSYQGQEELIEREKPDIVICQFVERMLEGYSPRPSR